MNDMTKLLFGFVVELQHSMVNGNRYSIPLPSCRQQLSITTLLSAMLVSILNTS